MKERIAAGGALGTIAGGGVADGTDQVDRGHRCAAIAGSACPAITTEVGTVRRFTSVIASELSPAGIVITGACASAAAGLTQALAVWHLASAPTSARAAARQILIVYAFRAQRHRHRHRCGLRRQQRLLRRSAAASPS